MDLVNIDFTTWAKIEYVAGSKQIKQRVKNKILLNFAYVYIRLKNML